MTTIPRPPVVWTICPVCHKHVRTTRRKDSTQRRLILHYDQSLDPYREPCAGSRTEYKDTQND